MWRRRSIRNPSQPYRRCRHVTHPCRLAQPSLQVGFPSPAATDNMNSTTNAAVDIAQGNPKLKERIIPTVAKSRDASLLAHR
jgi:hypothetical protein